ncbi:MAG: ABC transporter substrate-binding protein [Pseudonocardiaceae bacterium]
MTRRAGAILSIAIASLPLISGCGSDSEAPAGAAGDRFPMTVDTCGREVTIERPPERVMTVGAEAPALMWAVGAADKIKARAATFGAIYEPAEEAFKDVPLISPEEEPSREVIIGQNPDLLLGYGLENTPVEDLNAVGITQLTVSDQCDSQASDGPRLNREVTFENYYRDLELYGQIFGTQDTARQAADKLKQRVAAVKERFRETPKRTAAALIVYPTAVYVYGKPSITHTQIATLGLTDVFADVTDDRYVDLNVEQLLARDPDVLILGYQPGSTPEDAAAQLRALPGADRLTAIRDAHLITVEGQSLVGGLGTIDGLEAMADQLGAAR